jgi:HD-GYP domain-containing protein (c-di-GMP phosphodiesterase class II)
VQHKPVGFIYIEPTESLLESDRDLIQMVAQQCASALENLRLHLDLNQSYDHMVNMLARIAEFKDETTGTHVRRIDLYTQLVSPALGSSREEAILHGKASRLHDVGKIGISDAILQKPEKLSDAEFGVVRTHTLIGGQILENDRILDLACDVALHHHERWDGRGYPEGRPSSEFNLVTRIVSVVDVFDALVSKRPYKQGWEPDLAAAEIRAGAGTQFDPAVVDTFLALYQAGQFDRIVRAAREESALPYGLERLAPEPL